MYAKHIDYSRDMSAEVSTSVDSPEELRMWTRLDLDSPEKSLRVWLDVCSHSCNKDAMINGGSEVERLLSE